MVYYFTSNVVKPAAFIYVGKDKFENEDLIKYGLEKDVWVCFPPYSRDSKHNEVKTLVLMEYPVPCRQSIECPCLPAPSRW